MEADEQRAKRHELAWISHEGTPGALLYAGFNHLKVTVPFDTAIVFHTNRTRDPLGLYLYNFEHILKDKKYDLIADYRSNARTSKIQNALFELLEANPNTAETGDEIGSPELIENDSLSNFYKHIELYYGVGYLASRPNHLIDTYFYLNRTAAGERFKVSDLPFLSDEFSYLADLYHLCLNNQLRKPEKHNYYVGEALVDQAGVIVDADRMFRYLLHDAKMVTDLYATNISQLLVGRSLDLIEQSIIPIAAVGDYVLTIESADSSLFLCRIFNRDKYIEPKFLKNESTKIIEAAARWSNQYGGLYPVEFMKEKKTGRFKENIEHAQSIQNLAISQVVKTKSII